MSILEKEVEDPKFPRCKADRHFLKKKIGQTREGKSYWQCPKCKRIYTL